MFKPMHSSPNNSNPALLRFEIPDFASLSHERGNFVEPRPIRILNKSWHLRVYPRGHEMSRTDKTLVSCFLTAGDERSAFSSQTRNHQSENKADNFEFSFRIRNWRMVPKRCGFRLGVAYGFMGHTREKILQNGLEEDGRLVIDVALGFSPQTPQPQFLHSNKKQKISVHTKRLVKNKNMGLDLVPSSEFADLSFRVGQTIFQAHKCVLALRARTLLELALDEDDSDEGTAISPTVHIPNVDEDTFRVFLDYVYTSNQGNLRNFLQSSSPDHLQSTVSLFQVADKFGATDLKDFLEWFLANELLSPANCCEMILLADSHWCLHLKERAMNLFCSNPMASIVQGSTGWKLLEESPKLLLELLIWSRKTTSGGANHQNGETNRNGSFLQDFATGNAWEKLEVASDL